MEIIQITYLINRELTATGLCFDDSEPSWVRVE